jgi:hypothetical protein
MRFSAGEAAFEGFRVTRHHPGAVAVWGLVWVVSLLATVLTAMPILQPIANDLQAILQSTMAGGRSEPSVAMQLQITYAMLATTPISLVTQAILLPALYRAMKAGGRDRFAFIRLGRDELRVLAVLAITTAISLLLSQLGQTAVTLLGTFGELVSLAIWLFSIFVSVRLVLATPAAFSEGVIDLRAAWRLTARVFWPLLGLAIMVGVMACVVVLLLLIVALPVWSVMSGGGEASVAGAVAAVAVILLASIGAALVTVTLSAPFMAAYREMTGTA